ncbi:hypothetical protein E2C01_066858 [Portunus trituberculatus]|uniref:Uncharacterized protein n=1 Tax=Portunus trituberculatus TaxID=210409 RepID=A0A5B7HRV4_PORTR|nr:hypothetical protein [Portunus trituberculatus]
MAVEKPIFANITLGHTLVALLLTGGRPRGSQSVRFNGQYPNMGKKTAAVRPCEARGEGARGAKSDGDGSVARELRGRLKRRSPLGCSRMKHFTAATTRVVCEAVVALEAMA